MPLGLEEGIGAVVWSPLGWGRLTGKIRRGTGIPKQSRLHDSAEAGPQVDDEYLFKVVDALDEVAKETGKSVPQIALNWLLQRPTVSTVVVGARNEEQLQQNLGAADWKLTKEQIAKLDAASEKAEVVAVCAAIEAEIADLDDDEKQMFLTDLGLEEPGLNRLIRAGYQLLDLITYFTVGPKEARAWTIDRGTKAPGAAGVIHTDFEKGFIRAETIAYDDYVALNGESGARDAGKLRLEGKEYIVADGDVMHFRFNT